MNFGKFEEVVTCGVCYELFNEANRCPRMLSCGHTFCHSCLEQILFQNPLCPTCKAHIQPRDAKLIPVNFTAKGMIGLLAYNKQSIPNEVQSNSPPTRGSNPVTMKLESEGFCSEHFTSKEFRCMDCECWICSVCGILKHKQCRTLLIKDAYQELKKQTSKKVEKELVSRKLGNVRLTRSITCLEVEREKLLEEIDEKNISLNECEKKIRELQILKSEDFIFCENLVKLQIEVENSSEDKNFSKAINEIDNLIVQGKMLFSKLGTLEVNCHVPSYPSSKKELRNLCKRNSVYVVENENGELYGSVTVKKDQIWISCFQPQKPRGQVFPFKEFLSRFSSSSEIPEKAFLKLASEVDGKEEVVLVVKTDGTSARAKNFVFLCSALKRRSYKELSLIYHSSSSLFQLNLNPTPVINEIGRNSSTTPIMAGSVYGTNEEDSLFSVITKSDLGLCSGSKFGEVVCGLKELKKLKRSLIITDCGLVI